MRVSHWTMPAAMVLAMACGSDSSGPTPTCSVSSINISGAPATLKVGATAQLTADVTSQDCSPAPTVTWTTSAAGTASVSSTGLVTGVAEGQVTITAAAGGKSATAVIDVEPVPVASVRVRPDSIVIGTGPAATLRAEALDDQDAVLTGRTIAWNSEEPGNATVSATGTLTGLMAGTTAHVTATSEGQSGTAVVHVVRSRLAFFWNNLASPAGTEVPSLSYSYNSLAGALGIASGGSGIYTATFNGMARQTVEGEAMFTTAYAAPAGSYCRIGSWSNEATGVNCHAADGTLASMRFTVAMVGSATFSGRSAFAWIQDEGQTVNADAYYRFNPTGGEITSTFLSTGRYMVRFEGLGRTSAADREGVMVNSYGGTGGTDCQPTTWTTSGADLDVEVRCFDATGTAANSRFTILVVDGAREGATLGFAHADQPGVASYSPTNSAVRGSGSVMVSRTGTGTYTVDFTGFYRGAGLSETFLITATGPSAGRCVNGGWSYSSTAGTPASVDVVCSDPSGTPTDLSFSVLALQ